MCDFFKAILRPPTWNQKFKGGLYWWESESKGNFWKLVLGVLGSSDLTSTVLVADPSIHEWGPSSHVSFFSESFLVASCLWKATFLSSVDIGSLNMSSSTNSYLSNNHELEPAAAKSLQSCPTLCNHRDGSPPGSPVPGILQARTLEWVTLSFSNAWKWKVQVKSLSCVQLFATPWTAAYQAPPSMGFSRQEYWSGVPSPSPELGPAVFQMLDFYYHSKNWSVSVSSFLFNPSFTLWPEQLF